MILSKKQIDRYLRHIIMPEISGEGQKKLLESSVFIYGESVSSIMPLTLYLAAMGIGNIICSLWDHDGYDALFSQAVDLNCDLKIEFSHEDDAADLNIVMGSVHFMKCAADRLKCVASSKTIYSVFNDWRLLTAEFELSHVLEFIELFENECAEEKNVFTSALAGTICSIEAVKHILKVGSALKEMLFFDLLHFRIESCACDEIQKAAEFLSKVEEISCVAEKLKNARVLVVGAGGLGSPSSLVLALSGVGTIGLVDEDKVEESNLNRQVLHGSSRINIPKAESAKVALKRLKPEVNINTYVESLTKNNAERIIENYDVVIAAVDNIQTRYLINDVCYFLKKPLIEAGVLRFDGTNTTIIPDKGHCYRCLYPNLNTGTMSCAETGVLGAVPGVMGFIQGTEAYKIITGAGTTLQNKILLFDGLEMEFNVVSLEKNSNCPLCGKNPSITELGDYEAACKIEE